MLVLELDRLRKKKLHIRALGGDLKDDTESAALHTAAGSQSGHM